MNDFIDAALQKRRGAHKTRKSESQAKSKRETTDVRCDQTREQEQRIKKQKRSDKKMRETR